MKYIFSIGLAIIVLVLINQCESKDRFYRPNLPEELCSIGIIDADDTTRYISFEKSCQVEYPDEVNDSLRNLTFKVLSDNEELISYKADHTIKYLYGYKIPDSIVFHTGNRYFLTASEKSTSDISAEIIAPAKPPEPKLISFEREIINLPVPQECTGINYIKNAIISFTFSVNSPNKQYFAILLKGTGYSENNIPFPVINYLDFSIQNSNTPGFFAVIYGLSMFHWKCDNHRIFLDKSQVYAYFIDGGKIPEGICNITISVKFRNIYSTIDILKSFQIKILSIPEELYSFEKSLHIYDQIKMDPFSEPIYLNGNIRGGNGVFAVCRSSNLTYSLSVPFLF